jgi:zinc D-Ala-D-Ala carboxypeptidase
MINWSLYPSFKPKEFECSLSNECNMNEDLLSILQSIRNQLGLPIKISSGYRSANHPIEKKKSKPGEHTIGMAVDIQCYGEKALDIINLALLNKIRRIGINQKGNLSSRFIHLGIADRYHVDFIPGIWTY